MVEIAMGTVLSAAKSVVDLLQRPEVISYFSLLCCNSALNDLEGTVNFAQRRLLDAETQDLNNVEELYIERLKSVIYDADDLFDKFVTKRQQLIRGCYSEKVYRFFSWDNPIWVACDMCIQYKTIKDQFDFLRKNLVDYNSRPPMRPRKEESVSHLNVGDIIGREEDVKNIIENHLLNNSNGVSFLSIVGVGGMGKTTVAKLVYSDTRVQQRDEFPLKFWTCVSDHDQKLEVNQILRKIYSSITGGSYEGVSMESLQTIVKEKIKSRRFLLVLDDVWTEEKEEWREVEGFLSAGHAGSWILVTTRSHKTANMIGELKHELRGLSVPNSWCLLKKIASVSKWSTPNEDSVKPIGEKILERCDKTPLTIRVIGGILFNKQKSDWLSLLNKELPNLGERELDTTKILTFSYRQLETQLKNCFAYCALFPKGYLLKKELLLNHWMAHGYIAPSREGQTVEEVADQYFSTLLNRCFFYEVKFDEAGMIISFMIHDVMNNFARRIAGSEICVTEFPSSNMDRKIRHLAYTSPRFHLHSFENTRIRSYYYVGTVVNNPLMDPSYLEALFSNWTCLRALDFNNVNIQSLPESIGRLLHLRYLNLLNNRTLNVLPKSITKLYNLQSLKIGGCSDLQELPKDFMELVNLRMLEISQCGINQVIALPQLNILRLEWLPNLDYIIALPTDGRPYLEYTYLEKLMLWGLPKLRGWGNTRVGEGNTSSGMTPLFLPQLKSLEISECEQMKCNLLCPNLKHMGLEEFNEDLQVTKEINQETLSEEQGASNSNRTPLLHNGPTFSVSYGNHHYLTSIITDNLRWLKNMPMESFHLLEKLQIDGDCRIKSLGEANCVFRNCSSLVSLCIRRCDDLEDVISGGLEHLDMLNNLCIENCGNLSLSEENEEQEQERRDLIEKDMTQPSFCRSLRQLKLDNLRKLRYLPNWMKFLTALETLKIKGCKGLDTIPHWMMPILTSVKEFEIVDCLEQMQNCLIQHIPSIKIT